MCMRGGERAGNRGHQPTHPATPPACLCVEVAPCLPCLPSLPCLPCLHTISQSIGRLVAGQSLWAVLAIFCGLVLVGTTFISHTVGAMVILPIVQSVGEAMPGGHARLLVMGAALTCSGEHRHRYTGTHKRTTP